MKYRNKKITLKMKGEYFHKGKCVGIHFLISRSFFTNLAYDFFNSYNGNSAKLREKMEE